MTSTTTGTETVHRCLGCGRRITSAESIAAGRGSGCRAKVRRAARTADLSAWTEAQVTEARQAIEDGAVVPTNREGVYHVVGVDGSEVHLVHPAGCNCTSGLKNRPPRPCWHRCAVAMIEASAAPAPAALVPAPRAALPAVPAPAREAAPTSGVWALLEAVGATGDVGFIPAF
jgi:hypothetical protein